jgi:PIN domain nuclease of toxin-antitoxin system
VIVLDTHAWFWWVNEPGRLSRPASRAIERAQRIGVSTMSVLELADLIERRRIRLDTPTRAWIRDALADEHVEPLPLTAEVAVDAAQLRFAADPFDRIIYATARAEDAQLVTRDERMRAFDPELTVW